MKDDISVPKTSKRESEDAKFNLKAVVQKTGLKPDTLRAWERRYGLPNPVRTSGGHRLYSDHDIAILKWLIEQQEGGLSISRAVDLWHSLESENKNPLDEIPIASAQLETIPLPQGGNIDQFRAAWITACVNFNERVADAAISQALAMYRVETVCFEILQKGLSEIGTAWYNGEYTAQQEHFASALAIRRLEALMSATPPPTRNERILIGCAAEDEHTFPSLLLTLLLRRRGWEVVYLGANVPIARLEGTVAAAKPSLVILTAQTLWTAATLFEMAEILTTEEMPLAFGGLIFSSSPRLRNRIPGHFLGETLPEAVENIEQIIMVSRPYDDLEYGSAETQAARQHFLQNQAKIESTVWELMAQHQIEPSYLARANRDLSRAIAAALTLGDMTFIAPDMSWVEGLLMNYHYRMSGNMLHSYMMAYCEAAKQTLDKRGNVIIKWLLEIIE